MIRAILLLSGMIIGAGMFAIPFSFVAAGFWLGAAQLVVLSGVVLALHLLYGEIVLATPRFHRMPGYIRMYLGRSASLVSWVSSLFGVAGTLLAYLVIGSLFISTIAENFAYTPDHFFLSAGIVFVAALITLLPLKKESAINGILTIFEVLFIALFSLFLMRRVSPANFSGIRASNVFLPYGVLLFALSGASVIPDLVTVLGRNKKRVHAAIIAGSLIPAALYFFFAFAVVGVSGATTSADAIVGLQRTIGGTVTLFASIAGFLAIFTSFVALSANFQAMLNLDFGMKRRSAWLTASLVPFGLYLAGFQNFIVIVSAVGIFAFGVDSILLLLMSRRIQEKRGRRKSTAALVGFVIVLVTLIGVIAELLRIF